jgi:arginyl-tRNA synthetase
MEQGDELARSAVMTALREMGLEPRGPIDLRPLPFAGTWGVTTSVSHGLAGDIAQKALADTGALEGLSKKQAKQLTSDRARQESQLIAEGIASRLRDQGLFASVEAANGFVNISFDANRVASRLIGEILGRAEHYGQGAVHTERLMVEHSQPNTHKTFHVGHLRNSTLGVAISNILEKAGYPITRATYIGDIGMHVIRALWCYQRFHKGQEPADPAQRGRWLGQVYAESGARLSYRKDVVDFLNLLIREDRELVTSIDRLLKLLWRHDANTEDIAYLMGRFTSTLDIREEDFVDDGTIPALWPTLGDHLREAAGRDVVLLPLDGDSDQPEPTMTPQERLETWIDLDAHIAWWSPAKSWRDEVSATFQKWEAQDPGFVRLWEETREWSLVDFRRIFDELGAEFDVWFFESEVEEAGKAIVQELLDAGIAEISDGAAVVHIDQQLGLEDEVYRTMPILRSDGSSLYSTKDLALTKRKFEDYHVDRSIWVVDVRQSLYFRQIFKILEIWGFEQAKLSYHLPYEVVVLPEGVISSRKGRAPLYDDIRDLVLARARQIIDEKNPALSDEDKERVAWQVGIGSLKYAMLARDNNKIVVFDIEEALSFDGHAAPYIQYAHARACRILEHAGWDHGAHRSQALDAGLDLDFAQIAPAELTLLQHLAQFPEEIRRAAEQFRPLLIANYAFELAQHFNDFYHACPVIQSQEPVRTARLALVDATRVTLHSALAVLGIEAPAAM